MKFLITTILSAAVVLSLTACGNSSASSSSQIQSQPKTSSHAITPSTSSTDKANQSESNGSKTNSSQTKQSTKSTETNTNDSKKSEGSKQSFYGKWQIILSAASNPNGETYTNDEIKSLEGKQLTFSKTSATCFGEKMSSLNKTITNPVYKKTELSSSDFQTNYRVSLDKLPGVKGDSITEVDVTGTNGICNVFFTTQYKNMLILYGGGEFFVLERPNLKPSDVQAINEPKGDWVNTFEKNLYKGYHVIPSRYKSIGKGFWEVWVREVQTGKYPYVTVNQKTGNFHG